MQIAIVLFDRFTALDAVGPYQVLGSLPGAEVVFAAERAGRIGDDAGRLYLSAEATLAEVPHPDVVVVPGGPGQHDQMHDGPLYASASSSPAARPNSCPSPRHPPRGFDGGKR